MNFRTSPYHIADLMLQPHDFDLDGNICNVNALMCRKITSIYMPSQKLLPFYDAFARVGREYFTNKPAPMYLALYQIKRVTSYDLSLRYCAVAAAPPVFRSIGEIASML